MKNKFAFGCYAVSALILLLIGFRFVFAEQLFPFHLDVISSQWNDLDTSTQALYLGMMRTEGAGFLAAAAAIIILLAIPFRQGHTWPYWAIPVIGLVEWLPTLLANIHVAQTTAGSPPWQGALAAMVLLCVGFISTRVGKR